MMRRTTSVPHMPRVAHSAFEVRQNSRQVTVPDQVTSAMLHQLERQRALAEEIHKNNNGWTSSLETIAARLGEKSAGLKWMHSKSIDHFNYRYHLLMYVVIVLTATAGLSVITQVNNCGGAITKGLLIVATIVAFASTVASGIKDLKNWGARTQDHRTYMKEFGSLESVLRVELAKPRGDRKMGFDFVEYISDSFDTTNSSAPRIPGPVQVKYQKLVEGRDLADEDIIEKIYVQKLRKNVEIHRGGDSDAANRNVLSGNINSTSSGPVGSSGGIRIPPTPRSRDDDSLEDVPDPFVTDDDTSGAGIRSEQQLPIESSPNLDVIDTKETSGGDLIVEIPNVLDGNRQRYELDRFLQGGINNEF